MGKLPYARRFSELVVYQLAKRTADEIFKLTGNFPRDETFVEVDGRSNRRGLGQATVPTAFHSQTDGRDC